MGQGFDHRVAGAGNFGGGEDPKSGEDFSKPVQLDTKRECYCMLKKNLSK